MQRFTPPSQAHNSTTFTTSPLKSQIKYSPFSYYENVLDLQGAKIMKVVQNIKNTS